jgi:hypothetical protein
MRKQIDKLKNIPVGAEAFVQLGTKEYELACMCGSWCVLNILSTVTLERLIRDGAAKLFIEEVPTTYTLKLCGRSAWFDHNDEVLVTIDAFPSKDATKRVQELGDSYASFGKTEKEALHNALVNIAEHEGFQLHTMPERWKFKFNGCAYIGTLNDFCRADQGIEVKWTKQPRDGFKACAFAALLAQMREKE